MQLTDSKGQECCCTVGKGSSPCPYARASPGCGVCTAGHRSPLCPVYINPRNCAVRISESVCLNLSPQLGPVAGTPRTRCSSSWWPTGLQPCGSDGVGLRSPQFPREAKGYATLVGMTQQKPKNMVSLGPGSPRTEDRHHHRGGDTHLPQDLVSLRGTTREEGTTKAPWEKAFPGQSRVIATSYRKDPYS